MENCIHDKSENETKKEKDPSIYKARDCHIKYRLNLIVCSTFEKTKKERRAPRFKQI